MAWQLQQGGLLTSGPCLQLNHIYFGARKQHRVPVTRAHPNDWQPATQNKAVFQHPNLPRIDNIELLDARDALEACSGLQDDTKDACYMLFGCDPQGVEKYIGVVGSLEAALQQEPDPVENCWRSEDH